MDPEVDDKAASQLQSDLRSSLRSAHELKRPILTHLNADTTWLVSLPYPSHKSPPPGRLRYNILIDPWLQGSQEDLSAWFSKQWHGVRSSVQTISELEELLREAENLEREHTFSSSGMHVPAEPLLSYIDAVAVSHEFTDHCHRDTLIELNPSVPVFATKKAASLIRSWKHFKTVIEMPTFSKGTDWRTTSHSPLPDWIGISRLMTSFDLGSLHSAVLVCFGNPQSPDSTAETLIYTPHGIEASTASTLSTAWPRLNNLAFLHGLQDVSLAWATQLNLGAVNAVKAQKVLQAKYWIGTHDEDKPSSGMVARFLKIKKRSVQDALSQLNAAGIEDTNGSNDWAAKIKCVELRNGESLLLE
ncbi:hypothetical protein EDD37DRAFT_640531 [Exophiala viscosa]|uniref:Uncharacterized protein n=1 Tax=Exophiala viscosa TaxID=2486360 RepID=A0AAN6I998_9EURO|nr:hypothetical protein EDD36DRAFT_445833 [Exophiala viscosa]KAI1620614.1 hypothetical protein EDD37DRAFT_640531 [Exophiala viscosa]